MKKTQWLWCTLSTLVACSGDKGGDSGSSGEGEIVWSEAFDATEAGALSGIWGSGPDDVFAVGGDAERGTVTHYDGAGWTTGEIPGASLLVWVYGFGPGEVYTVGVDGSAARYDGSSWTPVETGTDHDLWGIFGFSSDEMWVVGGDPDDGNDCGDASQKGQKTCIWRWDGQSELVPVAIGAGENDRGTTSMFKVWGIDGKLFSVGQTGLVLEWDGSSWSRVSMGAEANDDFVSLWGTSADNMVMVGGRGSARIATYDGAAWTTTAPAGVAGINGVHMVEPDQAIVGGLYGWVAAYQPSTGELTDEGFAGSIDVHAVWGDGEGKTYAVGGHFLEPYHGSASVRTVEG